MHNHPEQRTRYLVSALYRYTQSLESGDLAGVAEILRQAEQDLVLERLLLEINEVYQEADASPVSSAELARVQNFLTPLLVEQETSLKSNGSGPQVEQQHVLSAWQHDSQERRLEIMKDSVNTAPTAEDSPLQDESNRPVHLPARKRRLTHLMQMLAATLVVGALLAGFLTLLESRHPGTPGGRISSASSIVALNSSGGTVYALRSSDGAELWHYTTGIVDTTLGSDTSLAVLNHVVYFAVRGRVFAFQSMTGKLLWRQDVLPASAHVFGSTSYNFALDGNVLLVRLANNGGETSMLFALQTTTGSILWHYDMNIQDLIIASHGIVYVSTSDTSGDNSMVRALRVADGKELWHYHNNNPPTLPVTILFAKNVLYIQADVFLPPVSNYANVQQSLIALNALTGTVLWSRHVENAELETSGVDMGLMISENGAPVLYNGYQFCAYRSSDGAQLWCSHDFAPRQAHTAALIPNFYAPAGQVLATLRIVLGQTSFSLKLEALNLRTGKTLWNTIPAFTKGTHSAVSEGEIGALVSGDSKTVYAVAGLDVYAYNASNGQVLWHIVKHVTGFPGNDGITGLAIG